MTDDQRHQFTSSRKQWGKLKSATLEMRREPTAAEAVLWQSIRGRRIGGAKFRRQHTLEGFVVDFVGIEQTLIIEVDGEIHHQADQHDRDIERQAILEARGFRILRFANSDIFHSMETVLEVIGKAVASTNKDADNS